MTLFGYKIIVRRVDDLNQYDRAYKVFQKVVECRRWFSGWKDLDTLWDYLLNEKYFGDINNARDSYARERKTDRYGKPKEDV